MLRNFSLSSLSVSLVIYSNFKYKKLFYSSLLRSIEQFLCTKFSERLLIMWDLTFISDEMTCVYCRSVLPRDVASILTHCKTCPSMSRPDAFRYKFVCYSCSYFTYQATNMKNHIQTHLREKPFECTICDFSSTQRINLKKHMKNMHAISLAWKIINYCN